LPGAWWLPDSGRVRTPRLPARLLEAQIAHFEAEWTGIPGGVERLDKLLAMADRETKAVVSCARALRLTAHAQLDRRAADRRALTGEPLKMPWE